MESRAQLEIIISDDYFNIQETLKFIDTLSDLKVEKKSHTPLHLGIEEVSVVLNIIGNLVSIVTFVEYLRNKSKKFEIRIKTEKGEIIISSKDKSWGIDELKKLLKNSSN